MSLALRAGGGRDFLCIYIKGALGKALHTSSLLWLSTPVYSRPRHFVSAPLFALFSYSITRSYCSSAAKFGKNFFVCSPAEELQFGFLTPPPCAGGALYACVRLMSMIIINSFPQLFHLLFHCQAAKLYLQHKQGQP